ncbi:T9SS type A sorting domain-containing protein [Pontibacter sp. CAU 1760]
MKKVYILLLVLIAFSITAKAQVIVYHENFNNTVSGVTGNFVSANTEAYADTLYTAGNYRKADALASSMVINNGISTYNLRNIRISWKEFRTQYWRKDNGHEGVSRTGGNTFSKIDNTNPVTLEYSLDGTTFVKVGEYSKTTDFFTWGTRAITLPAAVDNQPNVRFRWAISVNNSNTDYYAIDDVMIQGAPVLGTSTFNWNDRPVNENPFTTSASQNNPYQVDGVTLRWTRAAIGTGAVVETAAVTSNFQKRNTLTLMHSSGASSVAGTEVNLQLSKSVSGLTFSLLDIDQSSGQYKDRVEVIGYNAGVKVAVTKNMVLPRIENEYSNNSLQAKATAVDSKVNSEKGNVTISFVREVDKVVIRYFNEDAAKGRQAVAISNLAWSNDNAITTLPVELTSFKGSYLNGNMKLNWVTASELNNEKFVVERSLDAKNFDKIGEVTGKGTSSTATAYNFTDTNPAAGINYYRLRQVDFDGKVNFSHIVALEVANQGREVVAMASVYPTAASSEVTISLKTSGLHQVVVMDATGKTVAQFANVADRELLLPVQHLTQGVYFVSVSNAGQRETQRFVKR